nr:radical SAM protein [Thermoclostridium stercorarium]
MAFLREYPVKVIELGIQSLDEEVLQKSNRNYSPEVALSACRLVKDYGFCLEFRQCSGFRGIPLKRA